MSAEQSPGKIGKTVGENLRAARIAQNYTQGQLASPDFSVSYISAIERGQIHPSLRALEILAARLGLSSTQLLPSRTNSDKKAAHTTSQVEREDEEIDIPFLEIQLYIERGDAQQALTLLNKISPKRLKRLHQLRYNYLRGRIYQALGQLQESEHILSEAREMAKEMNERQLQLRIVYALAHTYMQLHNYPQALLAFQHCQYILEMLEGSDPYWQMMISTGAGQHYLSINAFPYAKTEFLAAIEHISSLSSPDALQAYYAQESQQLSENKQYDLAILYANKSLFIHDLAQAAQQRSLLYHNLALALFKRADGTEGEQLEQMFASESVQQDVLTLASLSAHKALWHLKRQELNEAENNAYRAYLQVQPHGDSIIAAFVLTTLGRIEYTLARYDEADNYFTSGLEMLKRLHEYATFADEAVYYAQLLEGRNKTHEALIYFRQAFESGQQANL